MMSLITVGACGKAIGICIFDDAFSTTIVREIDRAENSRLY